MAIKLKNYRVLILIKSNIKSLIEIKTLLFLYEAY